MPLLSGEDVVERLEQARNAIAQQIKERDSGFREFGPAWPWTLATKAQSYVFDLPAEALRRIRLHADVFNGTLGAGHYLLDVQAEPEPSIEATGYKFLGDGIKQDMWAREYDLPGMEELRFGYRYQGLTVNSITVPRQQNVCNIYRLTKDIDREKTRIVFVEIGGGYGSFALDVCRILPNSAYTIFDLPESLLFSASYLCTHRPDCRVYVYAPGDDPERALADIDSYDFAFIPNYRTTAIAGFPHIDIAVNSISFPEMSHESVQRYLKSITPKLRRFFMSINCRFPQNDQAGRPGTDDVLAQYFKLFPLPSEYREHSGVTSDQYDNQAFRPIFVGTTDKCAPLVDVDIRWVNVFGGRFEIKRGRAGKAIFKKA